MSLSDHPPIIDKKHLVGGESILRGNEQGKKIYLINLKYRNKKEK